MFGVTLRVRPRHVAMRIGGKSRRCCVQSHDLDRTSRGVIKIPSGENYQRTQSRAILELTRTIQGMSAFCAPIRGVVCRLGSGGERARCTRRQLLYVLQAPVVGIGLCTMAPKAIFARGLRRGEALKALPEEYPDEFPFTDADFKRFDETPDTYFYSYPRLVTHIDDGCVNALRAHCAEVFKPGDEVLDLCASYISYHPSSVRALGLGMNDEEMRRNSDLADFRVKDLNASDGVFPFEDATFNRVLCVVSLDYLVGPVEVLKQCAR